MAILWSGIIYEGGISGQTTVYTGPEHYRTLAQGEKFFVEARVTQVTSTAGTPQLAITLEHSIQSVDAGAWSTKAAMAAAANVNPNQVNYIRGQDLGTGQVGGSAMRLAFILTGTNPNAYVQAYMTIRSND